VLCSTLKIQTTSEASPVKCHFPSVSAEPAVLLIEKSRHWRGLETTQRDALKVQKAAKVKMFTEIFSLARVCL
jgi:hypothetical protein